LQNKLPEIWCPGTDSGRPPGNGFESRVHHFGNIGLRMGNIRQLFEPAIMKMRLALRRGLKLASDAFRLSVSGKLQLTNRPEHLLSSADIGRGSFRFELMDNHAYARSVFLDPDRREGFHSKGFGLWNVNIEDLPRLTDSIEGLGEASFCIISHPGFCGSTLVANMLEALPEFLVYREPVVWRRLTDLVYDPGLAGQYPERQLDDICRAVFRLFSRTWRPQQKAVVKSIPGAMGLDFHACGFVPSMRYVYLRPGLEVYLASLYRNEEQRFGWIDEQLGHEWLWLDSECQDVRKNLGVLSRHLRAALHWRLHSAAMTRFASGHPEAVLTIDSHDFFRDKAGSIRKVAAHFGRQAGEVDIRKCLQAGIVNYHSKERKRRYDDLDRLREEELLLSAKRNEIEAAKCWLEGLWNNRAA